MKNFFTELLEYNNHCNQQLIKKVLQEEDKVSPESVKLMCHILTAHYIWNGRIVEMTSLPGPWELHPMNQWLDLEFANYNKSIEILDKLPMSNIINYTTTKGDPFKNTIKDILFHVINHSNYHRAQIAADFKRNDIAPLSTDFILYKR